MLFLIYYKLNSVVSCCSLSLSQVNMVRPSDVAVLSSVGLHRHRWARVTSRPQPRCGICFTRSEIHQCRDTVTHGVFFFSFFIFPQHWAVHSGIKTQRYISNFFFPLLLFAGFTGPKAQCFLSNLLNSFWKLITALLGCPCTPRASLCFFSHYPQKMGKPQCLRRRYDQN